MKKRFTIPVSTTKLAIISKSQQAFPSGSFAFRIVFEGLEDPQEYSDPKGKVVWSSSLNALYQYSESISSNKIVTHHDFQLPYGCSAVEIEPIAWKGTEYEVSDFHFALTATTYSQAPRIVTIYGEETDD